ncbi:MAG: hypothetical protein CL857_02575 [Cryomorphaceae bacterium]|nr:hypothetical protein [Cryomorphaceae bacterium]
MDNKKNILDFIKPVKTTLPKEDYFAHLALNIAQTEQIPTNPKKNTKVRFLAFGYAAAAFLVIGFILFQQFMPLSVEHIGYEKYLGELSPNEILEYVESNIDEYSEDELIEASLPITEEEMESTKFTEIFGYIPDEVKTETIEQYLDEDFINLNDFDENELLIF